MRKEEKHKFPDCLDHLETKFNTSSDDFHLYEEFTCSKCGKKVIWKYKLLGLFDENDNLIKET